MQQTLILVLLIAAAAAAVIYFLVRLIRALEFRRNAKCGKCGSSAEDSSNRPGRQIENGGRSD